ncbi:MAG: hypothetical protein EOP43_04700 [Sphingobacteriaceae bacterium]|nr:MAG: hypothetical protein EOP43_04700 [Sphingobacteriaceae bacterium]
MSEAEKANQESDVFLQQARLKNYKSIIDAEIDFKPGLNIIIGNNGSGKTNFLNYLYDVVDMNWDKKSELSAEFVLVKKSQLYKVVVSKSSAIEINYAENIDYVISNQKKSNVKVFKNDILKEELKITGSDFNFNIGNSVDYYTKILQYGIPKEQSITEKPAKLTVSSTGIVNSDINLEINQPEFVESILNKIVFSTVPYKYKFDRSKIKIIIEELNEFFYDIAEELKIFTEINGLRISPNFNTYVNEHKDLYDVHNLYIEFFINNSWIPFSNLSDGNKRLFYIVSEVMAYNQLGLFSLLFNNELQPKQIILLEEPELGIHPHQLHKLMLFIKEQSKEKQIILTTHSPQVLNILDADELDRIIICNYDKEKGTQLRHLTEKETQKAKLYMHRYCNFHSRS